MTRASATSFSIVLPALNEGDMLSMTVDSIERESGSHPYEVIVVDDGSTDGSTERVARSRRSRVRVIDGGGLGVARARNLGAAHASGDVVVFMDAHCRVSPGWLDRFADLLSIHEVGLAGPSFTKLETPLPRGCGMRWTDYTLDPCWFDAADGLEGGFPVPLTTGACQAFRRETFDALGRYDDGFTRWGFEDVEMCVRAWLLGYAVVADPSITVAHYFRESRDNYDVDDLAITCNFLRMTYLHFSPTRIQSVLSAIGGNPYVTNAQDRLADSDVFDRREALLHTRIRDDEWFFEHVNGAIDTRYPRRESGEKGRDETARGGGWSKAPVP